MEGRRKKERKRRGRMGENMRGNYIDEVKSSGVLIR